MGAHFALYSILSHTRPHALGFQSLSVAMLHLPATCTVPLGAGGHTLSFSLPWEAHEGAQKEPRTPGTDMGVSPSMQPLAGFP